MRTLLDTGPIVAMLSASDDHHATCLLQARRIRGTLLTSWPVITEATYLLRTFPKAIDSVFRSIENGVVEIATLDRSDVAEIREIMTRYRSLRLQLADASLVHLGNRENVRTVFTLDRRDFTAVRTADGGRFEIVP